jgi:hypothetical protein
MHSVLRHAARIATALLAGAFLSGTLGLSRAVDGLAEPTHVRVRQAVIPAFRRLLLPMMLVVALATGSAACASRSDAPLWCAFAMSLAMPAITVAINRPVNHRILAWSPEAPPSEWRAQVARWNAADRARLLLALAASLCTELS